jgi:hypothetical protein
MQFLLIGIPEGLLLWRQQLVDHLICDGVRRVLSVDRQIFIIAQAVPVLLDIQLRHLRIEQS